MMRSVYPLLLLLLASAVACAQTAEPPMETLTLADGDSGSEWVPAEATMEPDDTHSRDGRAMHFHIDVNHETGQPDYPIGWPRTYLQVPEDIQDWSDWDFIGFSLYAETSREQFPDTALGFIVRSPDRNQQWQTNLSPEKGGWVDFRFELSNVPNLEEVRAVQFYISESNYNHGDVLDFWIDDLVLLRYAEPTIINMQPLSHLHYADSDVIRVEVELTGMEDGESVEVLSRLLHDGSAIRQSSARLGPGVSTIPLQIGGGLSPGEYEVQAEVVGTDYTLSEPMRVISSPFEEEAR
ncbi:MAG: hypothetical protein ACLFU7_12385 [Armatimonadota bacterium]